MRYFINYRSLLLSAFTGALLLSPLAKAGQSLSFPVEKKITGDTRVNISPEEAKGLDYYFIRYQAAAVAEAVAQGNKLGKALSKKEQQEIANKLHEDQNKQRAEVIKTGATIITSTRVGSNGMIVLASRQQISQLKSLSGVRDIARVAIHTQNHFSSVPWIGTDNFHQRTGITGQNIRVAVIDSGIDYLHANMGGSGNTTDYATNDTSIIEPGSFPTTKVIGGWDFAGPTYDARDPNSLPLPDPDPLDVGGHGSHVAGTVAGLGVQGKIGAGVAPGALLYAYKVFSDAGGSTALTAAAIERALDPNGDGSMDDHVDVINMSLGSEFGSPNDPSSIATQNAIDNGIIVSISAGNSGDVPYILGAPSVTPGAISVASSFAGNRTQLGLRIDSSAPALTGLYPAIEGSGAVKIRDGVVSDKITIANPLTACAALTNTIDGIALVRRGGCSFNQKYISAQNAGARAIIVYNDGTSPSRIQPIAMGGISAATIPGLMISYTTGNVINTTITGGAIVDATLDASVRVPAEPDMTDRISDFSSRGPGHGGSQFKPSVTAPGSDITSTDVGSGTEGVSFNGTSMAAPHIAGVSALLRAQHPSLEPDAIKSIIMNSAIPLHMDGPGGSLPYPLARQGNGRVDVDAAGKLTSYTTPAGVSFGRVNLDHADKRVKKVRVHNTSDHQKTYVLTHVPAQAAGGVTFTAPQTITVAPNNSDEFEIELFMDPTSPDAGFDDSSFSQTEADGWFVLNDGIESLRVGYLAVVDPASKMKAKKTDNHEVTIRNEGPSAGFAFGFTQVEKETRLDKGAYGVEAVGYRTSAGQLHLAVATKHPWETLSTLQFNFYLDTNNDGVDDILLRGSDYGIYNNGIDGIFVTAQFDLTNGGGFLEYIVSVGDYNDTTISMPFSTIAGGGLIPDKFTFRLEIESREDGIDTFTGSVDTANEAVPDRAILGVLPDESATVNISGQGKNMLWLLPNNQVETGQHMEAEVY